MAPDEHITISLEALIRLKAQARGFSFLPRQPVYSLLAGRHASRLRGRGMEFEEMRHYQAGDDVRQIDWKATLRSGRTQTRIYNEERERNVLLVVDQRVSMFFGSVLEMKSVTGAQAAALAAWRTLGQGDRVGAILFNDQKLTTLRPQRSQAAITRMLGTLAEFNHQLAIGQPPNPSQLNKALTQAERLAKHDFLVCIITDGFGQTEQTGEIITQITRHNDVIIISVTDPLEHQLPESGPLCFSNGGGQQATVDTGDASLRERYAHQAQRQIAENRGYLRSRAVPVIPLSTTGDVPRQLQHFFGHALRHKP